MSDRLEILHSFDEARAATGYKTGRALKAACQRHGIRIVSLSPQHKALRHADYKMLLDRASAVPAMAAKAGL